MNVDVRYSIGIVNIYICVASFAKCVYILKSSLQVVPMWLMLLQDGYGSADILLMLLLTKGQGHRL